MDAEFMPRKRRPQKQLRRGMSKRRRAARGAPRTKGGKFRKRGRMPRRRYAPWYRKLPKRQRDAIRRAQLLDDGGERAAYLTEKFTGQTKLSWPKWATRERLARLSRLKSAVARAKARRR